MHAENSAELQSRWTILIEIYRIQWLRWPARIGKIENDQIVLVSTVSHIIKPVRYVSEFFYVSNLVSR